MILEAFMPLNTSKLVLSVVHTIPHPSKPVQASRVTIIKSPSQILTLSSQLASKNSPEIAVRL